MEYLDLVDASGVRLGRSVARGAALSAGEFRPVVHVWIRDESARYLIQLRSSSCQSDPGVWATTAGHVLSGEDQPSAAVREVVEELGLELTHVALRQVASHTLDDRHETIYLAAVDRAGVGEPRLGPEVAAFKWASAPEIEEMMASGRFVRYSYFPEVLT